MPENVDDEAFQDFLDESQELLANLEPSILELEEHPDDSDLVDEPFRILHSIKGMSSFFNLAPIKNVSHRLEDLLGTIRDGEVAVNESVIDALFRGTEILHRLYDQVFDDELDIELLGEEQDFLETIDDLAEEGPTAEESMRGLVEDLSASVEKLLQDPDLADHPDVESMMDRLSTARSRLAKAEQPEAEENEDLPRSLFREDHEYGGIGVGESLFAMEEIARDIVEAEIEAAEEETVKQFQSHLTEILETAREQGWDGVVDPLEDIRKELDQFLDTAGFGYVLCRSMIHHLKDVQTAMDLSRQGGTEDDTDSGPDSSGSQSGSGGVNKTFRVEEEKVDDFMNYVGELIVTGEMYRHLQQELAEEDVDVELRNQFKNANQAFKDLSDDLQQSLMEIRKVKMEDLLKKFPVMVRKLSRQLDKEINVRTDGETIRVDKSLIEQLETPMTHLVRNAVDHGIEPPEEREEAGKNPEGRIDILVREDREQLTVEIRDDGGGLPGDVLRQKCVNKGLLTEEEAEATDYDEIIQYIFHPGVSTADEVTDVSGRGVGMDSVKQSVQSIDGELNLESEPGEGTSVTMTLPKAQAVIVVNGLVVEHGEYQFIIPLEQVLESVTSGKAQIQDVEARGEMLNLRGSLYPLFRLDETLGLETDSGGDRSVVMVLESETEEFAVLVDQIREQQKVVVKNMGPVFGDVDFVRGSAVMGDGRVCLVLDVEGLGEQARIRHPERTTSTSVTK